MTATAKAATARAPKSPTLRASKIAVSESNLRKAAARLLGTRLVSTEVFYVQRELGALATQEDLDAKVMAFRKMPWANIVVGE